MMPSAGYLFFPLQCSSYALERNFPHLRSRQTDSPVPSPQHSHNKLHNSLCLFYTLKWVHRAKGAQRQPGSR